MVFRTVLHAWPPPPSHRYDVERCPEREPSPKHYGKNRLSDFSQMFLSEFRWGWGGCLQLRAPPRIAYFIFIFYFAPVVPWYAVLALDHPTRASTDK